MHETDLQVTSDIYWQCGFFLSISHVTETSCDVDVHT
jgi:hypothetical protein